MASEEETIRIWTRQTEQVVRDGTRVWYFRRGEPQAVPKHIAERLLRGNLFKREGEEFEFHNTRRKGIRIGVSRLGGRGDGALASVDITAIKRKYPYSKIFAYSIGHVYESWQGHPAIDRLSRQMAHSNVGGSHQLWYDLSPIPSVIHKNYEQKEYCRISSKRAKLFGNEKKSLMGWINTIELHNILLGLDGSVDDMYIPIKPQDRSIVKKKVNPPKRYITIHNWAWGGRQTKCIPDTILTKVCLYLKNKGFTIYHIGAPTEDRIDFTKSLLGKLSFNQALALLSDSFLHVDNESTPAHYCPKLRVPCLVLAGPTNFIGWGHKENEIITRTDGGCVRCEGKHGWSFHCARNNGDRLAECMCAIDVDYVIDKIDFMIENNDLYRKRALKHNREFVNIVILGDKQVKPLQLKNCLNRIRDTINYINYKVYLALDFTPSASIYNVAEEFDCMLLTTSTKNDTDLLNCAIQNVDYSWSNKNWWSKEEWVIFIDCRQKLYSGWLYDILENKRYDIGIIHIKSPIKCIVVNRIAWNDVGKLPKAKTLDESVEKYKDIVKANLWESVDIDLSPNAANRQK